MSKSIQIISNVFLVVAGAVLVYVFTVLCVNFVVADNQARNQLAVNTMQSESKNSTHSIARNSILKNFTSPFQTVKSQNAKKLLEVPFVSEAPDNNWTGSWKNACEEASITMVDKYYQGIKEVSIAEEKKLMQKLFDVQVKLYGSDVNSDAARTLHLIDNYTAFSGEIVENPSIEDIIAQIDQNRPVIGFHKGFDLGNKNIPFLNTGSSYHSTVVVGYDRESSNFFVHDPGDTSSGTAYKYSFDVFMNSLHDYDYEKHTATGPSRVIFTKGSK